MKLAWAIGHIRRLQDEVDAYTKSGAYEFRAVPERVSSQRIDFRCFATEHQAPDPDWPLIAGDAIQGLRAALDHLVWAATPKTQQREWTEFPIFKDEVKFFTDDGKVRSRVRRKYADVCRPMQAAIERAQPFAHTPQDPLAILYDLAILDKHRTMVAVVGGVDHEMIGTTDPIRIVWTDLATGKTLASGETYVSAFTATTTDPHIDPGDVSPQFTFELLIEGRNVGTLVWIARRVFQVVYECETGEPVPMLAPYPI
jgi:hypothetical protein